MDVENFSLNISRETLQQNNILRAIKKNLVKKCLEMLSETAEKKNDYTKFSEQFGKRLNLCDCDEGYEMMLQGNDSVCVAKECGTFSRAWFSGAAEDVVRACRCGDFVTLGSQCQAV